MSQRNLGELDRTVSQPLGRIIQEAFSDGLVSEGNAFFGEFSSPLTMTSSRAQALMASGNIATDPGGSVTIRNFWSRLKVSVALTTGGSAYGAVNQLRVASSDAAYAISGAGVLAGAWDVFEASDTDYAVTFTNVKVMGCHAKLEIATGHVISSGNFHGVNIGNAVIPTMASATSFVGLFIEKDGGAQDWTVGIDINNATTGIDVGAATTGIAITGATTNAISITGEAATTALSIAYTTAEASQRAILSNIRVDNPEYGDGYACNEFLLAITGTQANHIAAMGAWINIDSGTHGVGGMFVAAQTNGVYVASGTITEAKIIFGMRMMAQGTTGAHIHAFSVETSGDTLDALIHVSDPVNNLGYIPDASLSGNDLGCFPLVEDNSGKQYYVRLYEACAT